MHARGGNWDAVIKRVKEIVNEHPNIPDSYRIQEVFVTGSLAYGEATPNESDADLVLGDNRDLHSANPDTIGTAIDALREHKNELADLLELDVTRVDIVEIKSSFKAPDKAMELQHNGQQLARQYDVDKDIEMKIYDAIHKKTVTNTRKI